MAEVFNESFPIFIVYGMTPEQYWDGEPSLAIYFKKAYELRREIKNEEMWLQGLYIREAIANALNGRKSKYPDEPFPLKTSVSKKRQEAAQEQNERKSFDYFMTFAEQWNKKFAAKQSKSNTGSAK